MIESLIGRGIDVSHACRVLSVSQSGYYAWKDRPASPRALRRIWLASEIADVTTRLSAAGLIEVGEHPRDLDGAERRPPANLRLLGPRG